MELWTYEHALVLLPTFFIMIVVSLILRKLLLNKSYELKMLPLKIIAVILVVIEIIKQVKAIKTGYNLYYLPLHFCSIFLYVLPLMAFYRKKGQKTINSIATATLLGLFLGMIIMPNVIYSKYRYYLFFTDFFSFHTIVFHNLVFLAFMLVAFLELHKPSGDKQELLSISLFGGVYFMISAIFAHVLKANFSNFLQSSIEIVNDLVKGMSLAIGETFTSIIYTIVLLILDVAVLILGNYLYILICKIINKITKKSNS